MYSVSTDYNTMAFSNDRTVSCSVSVNNKEFDKSKIVSLNFKEATSSGSNISLGEACSSVIELKLYDSATSFANGAVIKPKISFTNGALFATCPLGVFYVAQYKRGSGYTTVTAYDKMAFLNEKYYPTISFPATCAEVVNDIKKQYKITLKAGTTFISDRVITNIDCTVREMLGYVAGLNGRNARFNRDGELTFIFYKSAGQPTISEDAVYMNGIEKNPDHDTIKALVSGEGENEIKYGNGKAITFANPFMTKAILDVIGADILPLTYSCGKVKYRCNPAFEVGDIINIQGIGIICIMSNEMVFNGGLYANIESYGLSDEMDVISNYQSNPAELKRRVTMMEQMQNNILGATGGYYELLLDESDNNRPYGTAWWKDQSKTQGWKFTYGGLGYFNNNTLQHIGITNDGTILADNIATNGLITNTFKIGKSDSNYAMSFDGDTGKITFGSGVTISWNDISSKPDDLAHTSDIPTVPTTGEIVSDLQSDTNFNNTVTTITQNSISTATIRADQVQAGSFYITGGSFTIDNAAAGYSYISISGPWNYDTYTARVDSSGFMVDSSSGVGTRMLPDSFSLSKDGRTIGSFYYWDTGDMSALMVGEVDAHSDVSVQGNSLSNLFGWSSIEIKKDIEPLGTNPDLDAQKLYDLPVIQFKYKDDFRPKMTWRHNIDLAGFLIEDLEKIYPIAVEAEDNRRTKERKDAGEDVKIAPKWWNPNFLIPPMLKLIQDQHKEIDSLKLRLENIENGQVTNSN